MWLFSYWISHWFYPWLINQIPLEFWPIWFSYWFSHWLIILYYIIFFIIKIPWEGGGVIRGPAFPPPPLPAWGAAFPPLPRSRFVALGGGRGGGREPRTRGRWITKGRGGLGERALSTHSSGGMLPPS
jgi:hypothetical protein